MLRLLALAAAAAAITEDGVRVLSESSFENAVNENRDAGLLVEFYAPWCQHCQRLAPVYAEAARTLAGELVLAKVDATASPALAKAHGVSSYPALKFFRKGRVADASIGGDAEAIVSAARRLALAAASAATRCERGQLSST